MGSPKLKKIAIFGVGLIGGSFALALRKAGVVGEVVGFGRSTSNLQQARDLGIIDRIGSEVSEVNDADLVLLATPVGQMAELLASISQHIGANTVITDGGSTKGDVVRDAYIHLGKKISQFVPGHPVAGAEQSGASAAGADLYKGKKVILTPLPENSSEAILRVESAWEACGAIIHYLTYIEHDDVFAAVSHLPHLLSFALVHDLAQRNNRDLLLSFAASGFRDFTRIAASSPEMWRDICISNREALLRELQIYIAELNRMGSLLSTGDGRQLEQAFHASRELRNGWSEK